MADIAGAVTPYSPAKPYFGALPTWMPEYDGQRTESYRIYDEMVKNTPGTYQIVQRGTDASPIYVPKARTIINTINRYTAPDLSFVVDPDGGTPEQQLTAQSAFGTLFDRERWPVVFAGAKRSGLVKGDWAFHIVADEAKVEGRRISLYPVDPASLFRIEHPDDDNRITGYHLVQPYKDDEDNEFIRRQTYSKGPDPFDPTLDDGKIWSSLGLYELDDWDLPTSSAVNMLVEPYALPDIITSMPIYHIRNKEEPNNPWGYSEISGLERIFAALNQAVSDEDLALALEGLGVYVTTSGPPEEDGRQVSWKIGPGRVVEVAPEDGQSAKSIFDRVQGVGSVQPYSEYISQLERFVHEGSSVPAAALGSMDVQVAESGIALALKLAPIISEAEEKEKVIRGTLVHMYHDLKNWFSAYEGITLPPEVRILPIFGDKIPVNKKEKVLEIIAIVGAGLGSPDWGRLQLMALGYNFDASEGDAVLAAASALANASDPYAQRVDQEIAAE